MTDPWTDRLSDYLDGEVAGAERAALEAHLAGCTACRGALDELRRVASRARSLEDRPPSSDLWPGIAARIGQRAAARPRRFSFSVPELVAAGVALALVSASAVWLTAPPRRPLAPVAGAPAGLTWVADPRYDAAVAELQAALQAGARSGRLDSTTVRIVRRNLAIIDTAIAQARRALAADPGSAYLNQHLATTLRRKVELLRRAAAIVAARS